MSERQIKFKFGDLDLVLSNRLAAADRNWLENLRVRGRSRGDRPRTHSELVEIRDKAVELLLKCARDHSPNLTAEQVLGELPADEVGQHEYMASIAVALLQVISVIPTDSV